MAHSTVLVIVDSAIDEKDAETQAEELLAPFSDNLQVEPYYENEDDPYMTTYNPNSRWDWFVLGGRWAGMLPTKNGDKNVAQKKDVDYSLVFKEATQEANKSYDIFEENIKDLQPSLSNSALEYWCVDSGGREKFVQNYLDRLGVTYAILTSDGKWQEREMAVYEKPKNEWVSYCREVFDSLPDDAWMLVYDIHS